MGTGVLAAQVHRVCNPCTYSPWGFYRLRVCSGERVCPGKVFPAAEGGGLAAAAGELPGVQLEVQCRTQSSPTRRAEAAQALPGVCPKQKENLRLCFQPLLPTFCLLHRNFTAEFRPTSAADLQGRLTCPIPQPPCCSQPWVHTMSRGACSRRSSLLHQVLTQLQLLGTGSR